MKFRTCAAIASLLAVTTAACSSGGDTAADVRADGEPATVNIAYVPFNGAAPTFLGVEKGIYADHGLDVEMQVAQAPAAAIASLVSGDVQVAFTTIVTLVTAVSQGTAIRCLTPVDGVVSTDESKLSTATLVNGDSPVQTQADLAGKSVGVVALGSQNHLFTLEMADRAGIDPASIEVVQLPFAQMQAALESGQVDAVVSTQPFTAQTLAAGARVVNWPEAELNAGGNGTCWAASEQFIQENPEVVDSFVTAHTEAIEYAAEHVDEARAMIPSFLEITPEQAQDAVLGQDYDPVLNTDSIQTFEELMLKYDFITEEIPVDQLVYTPSS